MKKTNILFAAIAVTLLLMCNSRSGIAQSNPSHLFHVNTQYMITGLDSVARAERDAMLKEYFEKVEMKNEYILHEWTMQHYFSEDSREFVTIVEYATWADIDKAGDRSTELEKQAWPDQQKRKDFLKKMNSYFTYHKDAVYHELPKMMK
ncbi:MAG: hypothetical protein ABI855_11920 [Bacteroidota bacterium]